jgi:hypothetical protein
MLIDKSGGFGCIAYQGTSVLPGLKGPVDMGDNQRVVLEPPLGLDEFWRNDLGQYQFNHLAKSNFAIVTEGASVTNPTEFAAIESRLWGTLYSILLLGIPRFIGGLVVIGNRLSNGIVTHRVQSPYPIHASPYAKAAFVSGNMLLKAKDISRGLREIHKRGDRYLRVRRGFNAWLSGTRAAHGDERLHQFVRAVEAIIKPKQGDIGAQFTSRALLFASNGDVLSELYRLRSITEHMIDYSSDVTGHPDWDVERRGCYRAFQAEILAGRVYSRLLSDDNIRGHFATDDTMDAFWSQDLSARMAAWGKSMNLNELANSRFWV